MILYDNMYSYFLFYIIIFIYYINIITYLWPYMIFKILYISHIIYIWVREKNIYMCFSLTHMLYIYTVRISYVYKYYHMIRSLSFFCYTKLSLRTFPTLIFCVGASVKLDLIFCIILFRGESDLLLLVRVLLYG